VLKGVKADKQTTLKFLQANWRSKQLFLLEQGYNTHNFFNNMSSFTISRLKQPSNPSPLSQIMEQ
jgi:hypothetical protein